MKRLSAFIVLWTLLFNCIGNQVYTSTAKQYSSQTSYVGIYQKASSNKILSLQMTFYVKEIDSDDFLEFKSSPDYSENEIDMHVLTGYFQDRTTNENKHVSYKFFFNGEYDGKLDNRLTKDPGADCHLKQRDRYLLKIPIVFLSPNTHPPELVS